MKRHLWIFFLVILGFALKIFPDSPVWADWKVEWERTLKAAREEGEVQVFTEPSVDIYRAMMEFQKAHSKIRLRITPLGARRFASRVLAERRAGKYLVDVFSGGTTSPSLILVPAGVLESIRSAFILPEIEDTSLWFRKKFHFADGLGKYVFLSDGTISSSIVTYNTKLVRPGQIKSFWELLDPKWKGKIAAYDPRLPGGASNNMRFLYYNPKLGPKFITRLIRETDMALAPDRRMVMDWLATGRYPLALFVGRELDKAKRQGLPVDEMVQLKKEGAMLTSGAGSITLINKAPHPNAAKVFINWFLSRKGQTAWQKIMDRNSLRMDISKDYITNANVRVPKEDGTYIFTNLSKYDVRPARKLVDKTRKAMGKR